jgi:hypothetical protein
LQTTLQLNSVEQLGQIAEASVLDFSGQRFSGKRFAAARETDELAEEFRAERMSDLVSRNILGRNHEVAGVVWPKWMRAEVDMTQVPANSSGQSILNPLL